MIRLLFILLLSSVYTVSFSQGGPGAGSVAATTPTVTAPGNSKIIGFVQDTDTKQPVEFATVALTAVGSDKPIDGTVCDEKGQFTITKVGPGSYNVVVSFIGYETQTIENITVPEKKDEVNLGIIKLSTGTKVLNEVVVE